MSELLLWLFRRYCGITHNVMDLNGLSPSTMRGTIRSVRLVSGSVRVTHKPDGIMLLEWEMPK